MLRCPLPAARWVFSLPAWPRPLPPCLAPPPPACLAPPPPACQEHHEAASHPLRSARRLRSSGGDRPLPRHLRRPATPALPSPAPLSSVVQLCPCSQSLALCVWGRTCSAGPPGSQRKVFHGAVTTSLCRRPWPSCLHPPGIALCVPPSTDAPTRPGGCPAPRQAQPGLRQTWAGKVGLSAVRAPWTVGRTNMPCWSGALATGPAPQRGVKVEPGVSTGCSREVPSRDCRATSQATPDLAVVTGGSRTPSEARQSQREW